MRILSKTAPCPCESGLPYRHCHMPHDERSRREDRALAHARDQIHTLEAVTCERILAFIDDDLDLDPFAEGPVDREDECIARPWAAYDAGHLEAFMVRAADSLTTAQRAWIDAQRHVRAGLWEVTDIVPGRSVTLVNRLTTERRVVFERAESRHGPIGRHLFARVVDFQALSYLSGTLTPGVAPEHAEEVLQRTRALLYQRAGVRLEGHLHPAELQRRDLSWCFWHLAREAMFRPVRIAA